MSLLNQFFLALFRYIFFQELEVSRSLAKNLELELSKSHDQTQRLRRDNVKSEVVGDVDSTLRSLTLLRREYTNLKLSSVRDLGAMKVQLSNMARMTSSACLEVNNNLNIVRDSRGVEVRVGSLTEVYQKYQNVKQEKEDLEDAVETLERDLEVAEKKVCNLEQREPTFERVEVKQEQTTDPLRIVKLGKLEGENLLLRSSLQDIASMVEGTKLLRPVTPLRSRTRPSTPSRPMSRRRTRSLSSDSMESTVAAVQSALNRNQVEAHDLTTKLSAVQDKLNQVTSSEARWEARSKDLDQQLAAAKIQLDSHRLQETEQTEEMEALNSKLKTLKTEHDETMTKFRQIKSELDTSQKANKEYAFSSTKLEKKNSKFSSDNIRLEEKVLKLVDELREAGLLISQLERVGSSLREESVELREHINTFVLFL